MNNENLILGANGFGDNSAINQAQIDICKSWIKDNAISKESINTKLSSYTLKHLVEDSSLAKDSSINYVANGAFIKAAIELGYKYKQVGDLNAQFNMVIKK